VKKLASGILFLLFLFYSGGYYFLYVSRQFSIRNEVRREIKAGLRAEDITLITIPLHDESEIRWIKPDKEFKYKGELFDVVRIKIKDQKKLLYCFNDKKEKQLITSFHRQQQQKKKSDDKIRKVLNQLFYPPDSGQIIFYKPSDFCFAPIIFYYQSNFPDILSPPPNFA
jgi:hypothetical protein